MISYENILKAINNLLKVNLPEVNRISDEIISRFKKPAFFTQLNSTSEKDFNDYLEKSVTINIIYFSDVDSNVDNVKMIDKLNSIFKNKLEIEDRVLTISEKRYSLIDNILQFKFDLDFSDTCEFIEIEDVYIPESIINKGLGYSEENIETPKELESEV